MVVKQNPRLSVRRIAAATGSSRATVQRILTLDLKLHPFKFQMVQALNPQDYKKRLEFGETMKTRFASYRNIIFSDEAHFHLDGVVNKQNYRFWSKNNPQLLLETSLHP